MRQRHGLLAAVRDWQVAGVCQRLHQKLLNWLGDEAAIDWSRASLDSISMREKGGEQTEPNPVDRGKPGSKYHQVVDRNGIPLALRPSSANAHDATELLPLVYAIPRSSVLVADRDDRASVQPSCTPTMPTTHPTFGVPYTPAALPRGSRGAA